jgi:hypothetical protein
MKEVSVGGQLPIDFSPMADLINRDFFEGVVDGIDDSPISLADAISLFAGHLLASIRSRLMG